MYYLRKYSNNLKGVSSLRSRSCIIGLVAILYKEIPGNTALN